MKSRRDIARQAKERSDEAVTQHFARASGIARAPERKREPSLWFRASWGWLRGPSEVRSDFTSSEASQRYLWDN
jgi:hypothetical protein